MAGVLDVHRQALDKTDSNTAPEAEAYATLVTQTRAISEQVRPSTRRRRGLPRPPDGDHDMQAMSSRRPSTNFDRIFQRERACFSEHRPSRPTRDDARADAVDAHRVAFTAHPPRCRWAFHSSTTERSACSSHRHSRPEARARTARDARVPQLACDVLRPRIAFVDVDLRWGVDEESVAQNRILELCLGEVDRATLVVILLGPGTAPCSARRLVSCSFNIRGWLRLAMSAPPKPK